MQDNYKMDSSSSDSLSPPPEAILASFDAIERSLETKKQKKPRKKSTKDDAKVSKKPNAKIKKNSTSKDKAKDNNEAKVKSKAKSKSQPELNPKSKTKAESGKKLKNSSKAPNDDSRKKAARKASSITSLPLSDTISDPDIEDKEPHAYTIALVVLMRNVFSELFRGVPDLSPQDLDSLLTLPTMVSDLEKVFCRLLSLALNRRKHIDPGHFGRALEEFISANTYPQVSYQAPEVNHFLRTEAAHFSIASYGVRANFLKILAQTALSSSDQIRAIISANYGTTRATENLSNPLVITPKGKDSYKRLYYYVPGSGPDSLSAVYRQSNPKIEPDRWVSIAQTASGVRDLIDSLRSSDLKDTKELCQKLKEILPEMEERQERAAKLSVRKEKKRAAEARAVAYQMEKALGKRTRGKRINYATFETVGDDFDDYTPEPVPEVDMLEYDPSRRTSRRLRGNDPEAKPSADPEAIIGNHRNAGLNEDERIDDEELPDVSADEGEEEDYDNLDHLNIASTRETTNFPDSETSLTVVLKYSSQKKAEVLRHSADNSPDDSIDSAIEVTNSYPPNDTVTTNDETVSKNAGDYDSVYNSRLNTESKDSDIAEQPGVHVLPESNRSSNGINGVDYVHNSTIPASSGS
ncbi:hypothetical protein CANCADRAFT_83250 [Tortispora caseinolytica NRRL Y-17796]|uniref:WHIM1 domain-containing protein n=1 Tax=Tortispora caseinolytica NRRL Y-17796 TaxID=767744 RepID=A0A1E4TK80_9ASCO|nr:hypothetical protein CANCADRAFT_83250 [Tortispora caseinolytica NRRL Y-17796]